jgi:hypothetical protein
MSVEVIMKEIAEAIPRLDLEFSTSMRRHASLLMVQIRYFPRNPEMTRIQILETIRKIIEQAENNRIEVGN